MYSLINSDSTQAHVFGKLENQAKILREHAEREMCVTNGTSVIILLCRLGIINSFDYKSNTSPFPPTSAQLFARINN